MNTEDMPLLLTVDEARQILRIGRPAIYEAMRQGVIPHVRLGKQYRIPRRALLEWIDNPNQTSSKK